MRNKVLSGGNRFLRVFVIDWATQGRQKFDLGPTPCPLSKSQRLEKECSLDMARENAHFQQHALGYFAFNVSCGVAMINVCLWSKNRAANRLRVSLRASSPSRARTREPLRTRASRVSIFDDILQAGEVRTANCFSVLPLLHISELTKRDGRKKRTANTCMWKTWQGYYLRVSV